MAVAKGPSISETLKACPYELSTQDQPPALDIRANFFWSTKTARSPETQWIVRAIFRFLRPLSLQEEPTNSKASMAQKCLEKDMGCRIMIWFRGCVLQETNAINLKATFTTTVNHYRSPQKHNKLPTVVWEFRSLKDASKFSSGSWGLFELVIGLVLRFLLRLPT